MSKDKVRHPPGLYVLFGTEAAERFSFYTMRALLVLYLAKVIFIVDIGGSAEYRADIEQTLKSSPQKIYDETKELLKEDKKNREAIDATFKELGRDPNKVFLEEVNKNPQAVFESAFEHLTGRLDLDQELNGVALNELDYGKTFSRWVLLEKIKAIFNLAGTGLDKAVPKRIDPDNKLFARWVVLKKISEDIRDDALHVYGIYLLLVYMLGLFGGALADRVLGSRKAIFMGGIVMCAGLFVMWWPSLVYYGLGLIVAGNAYFKPNISTIVSGL